MIEYQYFYIPTNFTEPKWIQAIELRPGNREVVHHALAFYKAKPDIQRTPVLRPNRDQMALPPPPREATRPKRDDEIPGRLLATYAPGTNPQVLRPGTAIRLEPGGVIELQMHYTANGEAATDRTKIGFLFAKDPSPREVRVTHFFNGTLNLPAGAPDVRVDADISFVADATVWGIFPHTHVRGKKWEYVLELPDGTKKTVLSVPTYDFNWQTYYMFREPLAGARRARGSSRARGTTTRRRTSRIPIQRSTSSGATRRGKKCSTRDCSSARMRRRRRLRRADRSSDPASRTPLEPSPRVAACSGVRARYSSPAPRSTSAHTIPSRPASPGLVTLPALSRRVA